MWHRTITGMAKTLVFVVAVATGFAVACSDDPEPGADCPPGQEWDPMAGECAVPGSGSDNDDNDDNQNGSADAGNQGGSDAAAGCEGLECDQVTCHPDEVPTALSGTVTIPAGTLPLPDVNVYVPEDELQPVEEGASCEQCGEQLSATPFVDTTTNVDGHFYLRDVPVGDEVPLVVEVGKWRRATTVEVEPCQINEVDPIQTRLPRNQSEGEIPRIAITTGECDALECLIRKIGVDDSEITTEDGDGRIHLYSGVGGADRFDDSMNDGAELTDARDWWDEEENLLEYDIVMHGCECDPYPNDKTDAHEAFQKFVDAGGRAFLSHFHYIWLDDGTEPIQSIGDFGNVFTFPPGGMENTAAGQIDTSFPKGQMLAEWMYNTGTLPEGEFDIHAVRASVEDIDEEIVQDWITVYEDNNEFIQYLSFNTPVGWEPEDQCGRVVFSDIHVSGRGMMEEMDTSSPDHPVPVGCVTDDLSDQEKALVFMLFDLSACILPDDEKKGEWTP